MTHWSSQISTVRETGSRAGLSLAVVNASNAGRSGRFENIKVDV